MISTISEFDPSNKVHFGNGPGRPRVRSLKPTEDPGRGETRKKGTVSL